jgi:hypothetical protein
MIATCQSRKKGCFVPQDRRCGSIEKLLRESRNLNIKILPRLGVIDSLEPKTSCPEGHVHEAEIWYARPT